jgi:hypothetical protein
MIAEPSSDLWAAIKQKYNAWPPDNEDVATQLGAHLVAFASTASAGHSDLHQTGQSLGSAWRDSAGADMVDKASSVATDWSKIAQTAQNQGALAQNYGHALSFVKQTISGTVAANEPLYELLSASSILHPLRTRLVNHLADSFQHLVGDGTSLPKIKKTFGISLGGTFGLGWTSWGVSVGLITSPDGGLALTFSHSKAKGLAIGPSVSAGVMESDGQSVEDQSGPFKHVEASAGDIAASYDWGYNSAGKPVHTETFSASAGPGWGGGYGNSSTDVWNIPLP